MKSKETDPRLIDIDKQIFELEIRLSEKRESLRLSEEQLLNCDDSAKALKNLIASIKKDIRNISYKISDLNKLKQDEKDKIHKGKKDAVKAMHRRKFYENIVTKTTHSVDEYNELIKALKEEIEEHQNKLQNCRFRYEEDKEFKIIRRLQKQLKHYIGSQKILKEAINNLQSYELGANENE